MQNQIVISPFKPKYRDAVVRLLQSENLPVEDLPADLPNFFIATDNGLVIGVIGLEIYERNGLLRSMVVKSEYRKMKVATALINDLEALSRGLGLQCIFLLTETAQNYFLKQGYESISRNDAPVSLQQSSEFSHICPSSAILMQKVL